MRIYLDSCCLQRPWDDRRQPRIKVETEAVLVILAFVQAGDLSLLGSEALEYEAGRIPDEMRQNEVMAVLRLASERLEIDDEVEVLAESFASCGVLAMDAVHLALASKAAADFFCTCDDKLLRKCRVLSGLSCRVVSILDLVLQGARKGSILVKRLVELGFVPQPNLPATRIMSQFTPSGTSS